MDLMEMKETKKRIVIGISGASGSPIAAELLKALKAEPGWESHLVITNGGRMTMEYELSGRVEEVMELADVIHDNRNIGASIASGTFHTEGMIVVPCSMKTVAGIASGYSDNLLLRAADVTLKEGRKLILVARETPMHSIHLRNMLELSQMGAVIMPPVLSFYNGPQSVEDMVCHIVGKILARFGIAYSSFKPWNPEE